MPYSGSSYSLSRSRSPIRKQRTRGGALIRDPPSRCSLLVRNVSRNTRQSDLRTLAETYGPIRDIYMPRDYYSGEPRGIGFIEFMCPRDAESARDGLDGKVHLGNQITVGFAKQGRKRREEIGPRRVRRRCNDDRRYIRPSRSASPRRCHRRVDHVRRRDEDGSPRARRKDSYATDNFSGSSHSRRSRESQSTKDNHCQYFVDSKSSSNRSTTARISRGSQTLVRPNGHHIGDRGGYP